MDLGLQGKRALVTFVASPCSGYINGANFRIDGGYMGTL
jgi:hypothetical protein